MTQVAAFGCRLCDGPASFDEVRATWLDTTGVTYLLDRSPPHVRVFDDQGQFIRAFGRSGDGPGELRWPVWLGADTDGRIMVLDFQEHALVLYSPLGTPVGFHRLARAPLAAAYDGALHRLYVVTWSPGQAPGTVNIEILDLRTFALSGAIAKLTLLNRSGEPSNQVPVSIAVSEGSAFAVSEGNYRYRILRFDPDGRPHGTYDRHLARTMLSDAERQAETARRARTLGALQRELGQETAKAFASGSRAPDSTENYLAGISFDALGQLWVRSLRGDEIRTLFDVFGLSRQFLGVVQMKGDVRSIQFAGQYALTVSRGGLDEARVTLWRIPQVTATASRG